MSAGIQAIAGIGIGTIFTVQPLAMQASAPKAEDQGLAAGIMVAFRLFGTLIGLAVGATTFSTVYTSSIVQLSPLPDSVAMLRDSANAIGFIPHLKTADIDADLLSSIVNVYAKSLRYIWYILAAFGTLGFLTSLLTEASAIESEEQGRQNLETKT